MTPRDSQDTCLRVVVSAALAGLCAVAALIGLAPAAVDLDMDGREPALVEGVYAPERMYTRVARWTGELARIEWSGQLGVSVAAVEIELAPFFGSAGEQVQITFGQRVVRHTLVDGWQVVRVHSSAPTRDLALEIRAQPHDAGADPRRLGIRLDRVRIVNGPRTDALRQVDQRSVVALWLTAALAWVAGGWMAATRTRLWRTVSAAAAVLVTVAVLHGARAWLLGPSGAALVTGAATLASALVWILRREMTRPAALALAVACATAWLANAVLTSWYFVDVLSLDAWETVVSVEHLKAGTFSLAELWAPHNEHRPLTGRVVALVCAWLTGWNHWWEFAALQAVAALQVIVLALFVVRPGRTWRVPPPVLPAMVACFTATTHWETWLRGFSVHILAGVLAPSIALLWLCRGRAGWKTIVGAAALTVVGELSFGAGLLLWPVGAAVLAVRRDGEWQRHVAAWLFVGLLATALYVPGLDVHPDAKANAQVAFSAMGLGRMTTGVLVTLGMAVYYAPALFDGGDGAQQLAVIVVSALAVVSWVGLIALRWRQDTNREHAWVLPAALGALGLGACALFAAGRVSAGLLALTASRYLIFAACFWASWLMLVGMHTGTRRPWARALVSLLSLAIVGAMIANSIATIPYMATEFERIRHARRQLVKGEVGAAAHVLYPDPFKLVHMRDVLQTYRLSVFRPGAR